MNSLGWEMKFSGETGTKSCTGTSAKLPKSIIINHINGITLIYFVGSNTCARIEDEEKN